jgi:hypothetical protein
MMIRKTSSGSISSPRKSSSGSITSSPGVFDGHGGSCKTFHSNRSEEFSVNFNPALLRSMSTKSNVYFDTSKCLTREAVDHIVHDPISSGFLLRYCESHYCSENMTFITEIDRFRDQFHRDKTSWSVGSTWKSLDAEIDLKNTVYSDPSAFDIQRDFVLPLKNGTLITDELWPSQILSREAVAENIISIWDTFLAGTRESRYWICIPSTVLLNTMRRIKMIHIYGKEAFMEALIDPIKTIEKDIYPRFLLSAEYRLLVASLKTLETPALARNLKLTKPPFLIFQRYQFKEIQNNLVQFTLNDLIEDQVLYTEFLKYLEKIVSSENLLCIRAIKIFQDSFSSTTSSTSTTSTPRPSSTSTPTPAPKPRPRTPTLPSMSSKENRENTISENAWLVYRYFIASNSPYEISISYRKKKEVMRQLANPHFHLFDSIEQSVLSALKVHYASYILTKEYRDLCRFVLAKHSSIIPVPPVSSTLTSRPPRTSKSQLSTCVVSPSDSLSSVEFPRTRSGKRYFRASCFSIG